MDRCTGHCCFPIQLPLTPEELHQRKEELADGVKMAEAFVALGRETKDGRSVYACRHFINGQCSIHEDKPDVCERYPYERQCIIPGCTWTEVAVRLLPGPGS